MQLELRSSSTVYFGFWSDPKPYHGLGQNLGPLCVTMVVHLTGAKEVVSHVS